jgi:hypothetical protein
VSNKRVRNGKDGTFSLADARRERDKAKDLLKEGKDPSTEKQLDKHRQAAARPFDKWADEWLAKKKLEKVKRGRIVAVRDPAAAPASRMIPASCGSPGRDPRNPARDVGPEILVLRSEPTNERRLLVPHDKRVEGEPHQHTVRKKALVAEQGRLA